MIECDVKQLGLDGKGCISWTRSIGKSAATPIGVNPETLEIKWHPKRVPSGWENFWD